MQVIAYWIVIRRLGKHSVTPEFKTGKWDDETIFHGGVELSLFASMSKNTQDFVEHHIISQMILYITIVLMVVIFTELAI